MNNIIRYHADWRNNNFIIYGLPYVYSAGFKFKLFSFYLYEDSL